MAKKRTAPVPYTHDQFADFLREEGFRPVQDTFDTGWPTHGVHGFRDTANGTLELLTAGTTSQGTFLIRAYKPNGTRADWYVRTMGEAMARVRQVLRANAKVWGE